MKEFTPFKLDTGNECLWRRTDEGQFERIRLTPKTFSVLRYLVEHAGRLITFNELLDALWPGAYVQPGVLKNQILTIRRLLGDDPKNPRFVETQSRRGYTFIAPILEEPLSSTAHGEASAHPFVGRDADLRQLYELLQLALQGQRQIVFVTGEAGIGKTTFVDEFLRQMPAVGELCIGRGQCVEGFGSKEPYYPMLEALGDLCSSSGGTFTKILATQAPTWLVQFPALTTAQQRAALHHEILGATRERMLREICQALEMMASETPFVLVFEDLHWVDPSTVDLISALARRRMPSKLMLIGTYRPVDLTLSESPLKTVKQELIVHQLCHEIALQPLTQANVAMFLAAQSQGLAAPKELAEFIYRHSDGNPLFVVAALDHMRDEGMISLRGGSWHIDAPLGGMELDAPDNLRRMIELQIERLTPEEQKILEVASVLRKFSLAVTMGSIVAEMKLETVAELLEGLARRHQIIRSAGFREYRNGPSACYEFIHVLYRQVLYSRIGPSRKKKLHLRMAENGEALRLLRGVEMDTELAYQFEEGGDWLRAVKYLVSAADMAGRRFEPGVAAEILEHARELVSRIREEQRAQSEIEVLQKLCTIYSTSFDPRAVKVYESLVERAAHYGLAEVEVHALLEMAFPLALVHPDLYAQSLERALQAEQRWGGTDPLAREAMHALYLCRRMPAGGKWEAGNSDECRRVIAELQRAGDRQYLWEVQLGFGFPLFNLSEYREALRNAGAGFTVFLENFHENPYLTWHFQLHKELVCSCLLFLGEWGAALIKLDEWVETAEKNGDRHSVMVARLGRLELLVQAMDFEGARLILDSALVMVSSLPRVRRYWLIWAGLVERGLGNHHCAMEYLSKCKRDMVEHPLLSDWYYRVPLELALTETWLAQGELEKAKGEAAEALKAALATQERTFRALAFELSARLSLAERQFQNAQQYISHAIQEMEGFEVPLAHWKVHALASDLHAKQGEAEFAAHHLSLSRNTILKLADSLRDQPSLRQRFLDHPQVRKILDGVTTAVA